ETALVGASLGNINAISDAATGMALAKAALTGAAYNVRINTASLKNEAAHGKILTEELKLLEGKAAQLEIKLKDTLKERASEILPAD
ncbi:MAG: cyclodeaminase/cyclohydrolase family protein, partial [Anaerolineaceae bacterium]|nr:cyclodeaminase/cyclohydrolase family protein [Anaerolineaceae bacterium]